MTRAAGVSAPLRKALDREKQKLRRRYVDSDIGMDNRCYIHPVNHESSASAGEPFRTPVRGQATRMRGTASTV